MERPKIIHHASKQPYLSIGRYYGGIKAFDSQYIYLPDVDAFLRYDFHKLYKKHIRAKKSWESFIELVNNL